MANLFIAYNLNHPNQNVQRVESTIESLGNAIKIQLSMYYLKTKLNAWEVEDQLWKLMDSNNDRLVVIDAQNGYSHNLFPGADKFIDHYWRL